MNLDHIFVLITNFIQVSSRYTNHRQEWDGTIVQTTHERDDQERDDNYVCNSLHRHVLVRPVTVYANQILETIGFLTRTYRNMILVANENTISNALSWLKASR